MKKKNKVFEYFDESNNQVQIHGSNENNNLAIEDENYKNAQ
jgi:hypothetical protein